MFTTINGTFNRKEDAETAIIDLEDGGILLLLLGVPIPIIIILLLIFN